MSNHVNTLQYLLDHCLSNQAEAKMSLGAEDTVDDAHKKLRHFISSIQEFITEEMYENFDDGRFPTEPQNYYYISSNALEALAEDIIKHMKSDGIRFTDANQISNP